MDAVAWEDRALCPEVGDPEIFFSEARETRARARRVCRLCPVSLQCLEYALENELTYGIWGGLSGRQRAPRTYPPSTPSHRLPGCDAVFPR